MSSIDETFARLRSQQRMAFMPFVTAGDPDLSVTQRVIRELALRGVDMIEIGFPYSDPIADGPVIQASYTRALAKQLHINDIFEAIAELSREAETGSAARKSAAHVAPLPPLVAMVAYAIVFRTGSENFVRAARDAGFAGMIIPDLPADEAAELAEIAGAHGLDLIQLIAPTTTPARAGRILESARGFLYCISVAGTTGVRDELPPELKEQLTWLKSQTQLPLAVGFGVSRPDQVAGLRGLADGVIVGSALVRQIAAISEQRKSVDSAIASAGELAAEMLAECHRA
jgi:tryptophan synthase alpha chain